ncbi:hypothetical protein DGMP_22300 [Desulfomarina profundi]|uniref:Exoribonuclease phosphorolytic domain-containing protein n=1 Tax=Desulfomarina profundi TaxID=2772557 RepID=A0A8D5JMG1_9BACT|nr:hypothetical protein DGMP_22300 [Desulfomarina profundi]
MLMGHPNSKYYRGGLAVRDALKKLVAEKKLENLPEILPVAAISVGIVGGIPLLDLDYSEDSAAEADANFVMSADGRWIEIQSTAEGIPFAGDAFLTMMGFAEKGIRELFSLWKEEGQYAQEA